MPRNLLFLYGAPASGKTTLARRLADALGAKMCDLDEAIVARTGRSIAAIFAEDGEPAFRRLEAETLQSVVSDPNAPRVIALGGGTLLRDANRALCEASGTVLCLDAPDEAELARRLGAAPGIRPLGDRARTRAAHYASFPNRIARTFALPDSLVVAGRGLAPCLLHGLPLAADATVAARHGARFTQPTAVIPSGERHKTPATILALWQAFARAGLGRRDRVAALGGGVTGDLVGFAAATWMRGIAWINAPTTLLAMVDASTGGKTGCDLPEGKNLAGAFHSPRLVAIDTDFLATLPPEILAEGRAEMIKHEAIGGLPREADPSGAPTAAEIADNLAVKVGIVREDPFERLGRRLLLNCGHTVAHALEKGSHYALSHGAAVAIGCVAEARLAVRHGFARADWPDELAARFRAAGLPTELPAGTDMRALWTAMKGDKKRAGNTVTFALPCGWGDVRGIRFDMDGEKPL